MPYSKVIGSTNYELRISNYQFKVHEFFSQCNGVLYSQSWTIKLCYKPYTKEENNDSYPLNIKRPWP